MVGQKGNIKRPRDIGRLGGLSSDISRHDSVDVVGSDLPRNPDLLPSRTAYSYHTVDSKYPALLHAFQLRTIGGTTHGKRVSSCHRSDDDEHANPTVD